MSAEGCVTQRTDQPSDDVVLRSALPRLGYHAPTGSRIGPGVPGTQAVSLRVSVQRKLTSAEAMSVERVHSAALLAHTLLLGSAWNGSVTSRKPAITPCVEVSTHH
jgi:hypothetical protein